MAKRRASVRNVTLVASSRKDAGLAIKPGTKLEVVSVQLAGPDVGKARRLGARLCGGTSTCLALIDIGAEVSNPPVRGRSARK